MATETTNRSSDRDRALTRLQVDRLPVAYILMDAEWRVREWNPTAETIFGFTAEDVLGHDVREMIVPLPVSEQLQETRRRLAAGDMDAHSVNENRTKDGRIITCRWFNTPLIESDGRFGGVIALAEDITQRIRSQRALAESHALLRAVIEGLPDAIYVKDHDSRYLLVNSVAARIMGTTVEQVPGGTDLQYFAPETARRLLETDRRLIESGKSQTFEEVITAAGVTGTYLTTKAPFRSPDGKILILGVSRDVTERKKNVEELKRQKEILQSIFDHIPLMIRFRDSAGRIQLVNRHWEEMMGWTLEEVQERDMWSEFYPDPVARERALEIARHSSGKWADGVVRVRDGSNLDISWASIRLSDGTTIGIAQDATERKQDEQARAAYASRLQALSRRLVEVQEMERRHLARELHDEIGQSLTSLSLLLKPNGEMSQGAVRARDKQARDIVDELFKRIRDLSCDLRPAALDLLGLVPALITLFERYTDQMKVRVHFKHHQVEQRFASELETTAYRLVQEALTNAARHAVVDEVVVRVWANTDILSVQIEDRGRGFDPEAALAKPTSSGLAGMHERVKLLDGRLTVESSPGFGTQITAELPLNPAARSLDNDDLDCFSRRPSRGAPRNEGASGI